MTKIVIGAANFKKKYGINKKKFKDKKIKLVNTLKKNKLNFFDTSFSYNIDGSIINHLKRKIKIITKIKLPKKNQKKFIENLDRLFDNELEKIKIKKFDSLLLHNVNDLNSKYRDFFLQKLFFLKKKKKFKYFGVSIYEPRDLDLVLDYFNPDIIQFPLSLLNNIFVKKKNFKKLLETKAILQARSIFLQGLLLNDYNHIKKMRLHSKLKLDIFKFFKWCDKKKISKLDACIQFVRQFKEIDIVTFGIDTSQHLEDIIKSFKKKNIEIYNHQIYNYSYYDPRNW